MRRVGPWVLAGAVALGGCSESDVEQINKVGNKALDLAGDFTVQTGEELGVKFRKADAGELELTARVYARLRWDQELHGAVIQVRAEGGHVLLTGTVRSHAQRRRARELAGSTAGVISVSDELHIADEP
jgi:osmotically-inducible protein OsmY